MPCCPAWPASAQHKAFSNIQALYVLWSASLYVYLEIIEFRVADLTAQCCGRKLGKKSPLMKSGGRSSTVRCFFAAGCWADVPGCPVDTGSLPCNKQSHHGRLQAGKLGLLQA